MEADWNGIYAAFHEVRTPAARLQIVKERYPDLPEGEAAALAAGIARAQEEIEDYFYQRYQGAGRRAVQRLQREGYRWAREKYPWLNEENLRHTANRAMYYAWHG